MRAVRRSVSLAASLLLLALPAVAPAQTPGDEQYTDPFGGEQDQSGSEPSQEPEPEETPAPSEPETSTSSQEPAAPAPEAPEPAAAPAAEQLPRTGADAGALALGGTLLLAGGVALRVRVSERRPRRP